MTSLAEVARAIDDHPQVMAILCAQGAAYELLQDHRRALENYEAHLQLAQQLEDKEEISRAARQLVLILMKQAAVAESYNKLATALSLYRSAVSAASHTTSHADQAEAHFHTGRMHMQLGQPKEAVPYLQAYVSRQTWRRWKGHAFTTGLSFPIQTARSVTSLSSACPFSL